MKKPLFIVSLITICCCLSCEREPAPMDWSPFKSEASLNGNEVWEANVSAFRHRENGDILLQLIVFNSARELREMIRLKYFPLQEGNVSLQYQERGLQTDSIAPTAYFDTFVADGDASTEFYDLLEADEFDHFVEIERISDDGKEIEGTFQLAFVISEHSTSKFDVSRPDTLIFTNGHYKAHIHVP